MGIGANPLNVMDFFQMSIDGILERKFRFGLNLVGILIGCAAVTGLISMTQGMRTDIVDQLGLFGATTIQVYPGSSDTEAFVTLDWRDIQNLKNIPGVEYVAPVQAGYWGSFSFKGENYYRELVGIDENWIRVHDVEDQIDDGNIFNNNDGNVAILGYNIWNQNGHPLFQVGDRLNIQTRVNDQQKEFTLRVIGLAKQTAGFGGSGVDDLIVLPLKSYEQIFETGGKYLAADLKVESISDVSRVTSKLDEDFDEFNYHTSEMIMEEINGILGTINAVLGGIAGISLLVAGIGIINTMTVSVLERFREIGTMKAIGASNFDILYLFLSESIVTGILGGSLGVALGFGLSRIMGGFIGLATHPTFDLTLMVVGFAVVTCVVAGAYPAWRASNLHPVEALRHE